MRASVGGLAHFGYPAVTTFRRTGTDGCVASVTAVKGFPTTVADDVP